MAFSVSSYFRSLHVHHDHHLCGELNTLCPVSLNNSQFTYSLLSIIVEFTQSRRRFLCFKIKSELSGSWLLPAVLSVNKQNDQRKEMQYSVHKQSIVRHNLLATIGSCVYSDDEEAFLLLSFILRYLPSLNEFV